MDTARAQIRVFDRRAAAVSDPVLRRHLSSRAERIEEALAEVGLAVGSYDASHQGCA